MAQRLRLGILGAARNVPFSVIEPVRANPDLAERVEVAGLASLEQSEAEAFVKEWGIPKAYASYEELLADESIDAVYNVLPTTVRCQWSVRALRAGKHVLSETPLSSNAMEAVVAQRAAEDHGRVLLEGTHPTCHPVTKRVREMLLEGKIGSLERIDLDLPVGHSLQGKTVCSKTGALMGLGCHGVAIVRALAGDEPWVVNASAKLSEEAPDVDSAIGFDLQLPNGVEAHVACSVEVSGSKEPTTFTISGSYGTIKVKEWFTSGKSSNEIALETFEGCGESLVERVDNPVTRDTFYFQLMTFVDEVAAQGHCSAAGMPWKYTKSKGPADAVRNMALIDAIYRAASMAPRPTIAAPPEPYDRIGLSKL
eukprot:CAMPEP_0179143656 /NCGR_PEP_ID=MMETSP0796-20121207/69124_1 /TAXON_ID=73915 /ORGANISM="Pyrodinium bahamense, Strain pbaha01" /LENGTH=366 /DNA_ID=CAMNT_0020843737 /DNA_START=81 /DNA_END=1181 /DNA_ORIENTATION=-